MLLGNEGLLGGLLGRVRGLYGGWFSCMNVLGFVNVVKASFYRQRRRQILFQIGRNIPRIMPSLIGIS